jgi:hypothetical protein
MLDRTLPMALVLLALTAGCKKSDEADPGKPTAASATTEPAKCSKDADCKGGTLCESSACVPAEVARKVREAAKKEASVAPAPATSAEPPNPIPAIPTEKSNPPKTTEWDEGKDVNTQETNSQPDKCTMRILREWLQISCREDYSSYEKMENFGLKNADYFEFVQPGRVVSFVVRLQRGKTQTVRICGEGRRATLFVNWPAQKDRPVHVALGKGPACEGEDDQEQGE